MLPAADDRRIYGPYPTGRPGEERFADPAAVVDALNAHTGSFNLLIQQTTATMPVDRQQPGPVGADGKPTTVTVTEMVPNYDVQAPARLSLCAAVAAAFGLVPFDPTTGQGLTQREIILRYNDFVAWQEGVKKNAAPSPAHSPPTAPPSFWQEQASRLASSTD